MYLHAVLVHGSDDFKTVLNQQLQLIPNLVLLLFQFKLISNLVPLINQLLLKLKAKKILLYHTNGTNKQLRSTSSYGTAFQSKIFPMTSQMIPYQSQPPMDLETWGGPM